MELGGSEVHLSSSFDNFKHHQILARSQHQLSSDLVALTNQSMDRLSKTQENIVQVEQLMKESVDVLSNKLQEFRTQLEALQKRVNRGTAEPQTVDNSLATRVKHLEVQEVTNQQIIKSQKKEISDLKAELQTFRREYHHQQQRGHPTRHTGRETQGS